MVRWLAGTRRLSLGGRVIVIVATLLVGWGLVEVSPGFATKRIRSLAHAHASSADPAWNIPVNGAAFKRAAATVGRGSTYYLSYPPSQPQYSHDLLGAGLLFLTPALPVKYETDADWVIAYARAPSTLPGVRPVKTTKIANGVYLVRTAH
jgi:hypothetical protein